MILNGK